MFIWVNVRQRQSSKNCKLRKHSLACVRRIHYYDLYLIDLDATALHSCFQLGFVSGLDCTPLHPSDITYFHVGSAESVCPAIDKRRVKLNALRKIGGGIKKRKVSATFTGTLYYAPGQHKSLIRVQMIQICRHRPFPLFWFRAHCFFIDVKEFSFTSSSYFSFVRNVTYAVNANLPPSNSKKTKPLFLIDHCWRCNNLWMNYLHCNLHFDRYWLAKFLVCQQRFEATL